MNNRTLVLLAILMLVAGLSGVLAPRPVLAAGTNYYVDSVNGSDTNSGTAPSSPWKTLTKIQGYAFQPGDAVNFKRGSSWTSGLDISRSGVQNSPITFRDYGTGPRPTISNPGTG